MADDELLKPTLHVEVLLKFAATTMHFYKEAGLPTCEAVAERLREDYVALSVGDVITEFKAIKHELYLDRIEIADYTGPESTTGSYNLQDIQLDVQAYVLKAEQDTDQRRNINQADGDEKPQARVLPLPNVALDEAWSSLVFDDNLPAILLRSLVEVVSMTSQPDLNLSAFNWNRLCLLHGPPGSGKSTLSRALAQKLSIRLGNDFAKSMLVEINTNGMLSKYFGESGKLIGAMFERVYTMAQDRDTLVCVVMDEVETIAGSRQKSSSGAECADGLRATNQLLTALDRLRNLPNVIILCTSNLIEAIDPAFLDRVDIDELIPSPSPAAIYNIFRSCLNELVRSSLVDAAAAAVSQNLDSHVTPAPSSFSSHKPKTRASTKRKASAELAAPASSLESWTIVPSAPTIPTFSEMKVRSTTCPDDISSPGPRVWSLAKKCEGFSGRTLRRLPMLGLARYTLRGNRTVDNAVSALEKAIERKLVAVKERMGDVRMNGM